MKVAYLKSTRFISRNFTSGSWGDMVFAANGPPPIHPALIAIVVKTYKSGRKLVVTQSEHPFRGEEIQLSLTLLFS